MPRANPVDRFQELVDAATGVFLDLGYRRAQMADVAARMGVAKGTVYLYVESKEALFHAVLRHGDGGEPIPPSPSLPVPTPPREATLEIVRKRVAESAQLPVLNEALLRHRVTNVRAELEAIVLELYDLLSRHRVGIKLIDRCAADHPELAEVWHGTGRRGAMELLRRYLEDRIRRGRIPPVEDVAVTARVVLEHVVTWGVHRHWDAAPQVMDQDVVRRTVASFVVHALLHA